jgi:hypothetical protein
MTGRATGLAVCRMRVSDASKLGRERCGSGLAASAHALPSCCRLEGTQVQAFSLHPGEAGRAVLCCDVIVAGPYLRDHTGPKAQGGACCARCIAGRSRAVRDCPRTRQRGRRPHRTCPAVSKASCSTAAGIIATPLQRHMPGWQRGVFNTLGTCFGFLKTTAAVRTAQPPTALYTRLATGEDLSFFLSFSHPLRACACRRAWVGVNGAAVVVHVADQARG